jgi:hypothetical protein
MSEPEPVDEKQSTPEIRGGDRPADYIPQWGHRDDEPDGQGELDDEAEEGTDEDS